MNGPQAGNQELFLWTLGLHFQKGQSLISRSSEQVFGKPEEHRKNLLGQMLNL